MLLPFLVACCSGAVVLASQHPLSPPPLQFDNSSAPFIFNSLSSLLVQWPNTYHGNGHTVIPGILEPYTLLYHARKDTASPPPSPEWFAFDPEMSYGIMAGRRGQTFLHTYRNIRPARIVYFDGMSAALNQMGWLDSQEILFNNGSDRSDGYPSLNEYDRARKLCAWGQEFGVEGFVRMNAGFELMWCDFRSPTIQLVSHLNITAPGTPPGSSDMPPGPPPGSGRPVPPTGPPGRDAPTRGRRGGMGGWSPFGMTGFSEWLRAASQRGTVPQPHILLDYASLVTFYHPRLRSLAQTREGQPMRQHRIWTNISDADAQSVVDEIEDVLGRPPWRRVGSGMDWGALTRNVVEEWASRVVQLHEFLGNASAELDSGASVNTTATLQFVRRLTYSPLNPFMDTGASSNSTAWDWFGSLSVSSEDMFAEQFPPHRSPPPPPHPVAGANASALRRCMYSATGFLNDPRIHKTPQELLLQASVETVLQRLCSDYGAIFIESMDADEHSPRADVRAMVGRWETRVASLMEWLDWTEWLRCDEVCPRNTVCAMPMWPLANFGRRRRVPGEPEPEPEPEKPEDWKPRCMSLVPEVPSEPGGPRITEIMDARSREGAR
ncbi:hypothetical protein POSPLADRAFT_1053564 [Postia placenta MAD-698-R-SB12]|uniref:Uncharacterized protein n=1 Tax=Postia placenta MAD-698-R-SB12 TaxID=670580 RepID=A0A1X6N8P6_9APHY|nr:hypothetical protein POSPLADRAFT_1053564 [Postia placenta MAD-698-R-SB12]OSX64753.1 hypothetical protein POSPLADRAFT_1053564 [Postia placenta MAD-698-R-SB12]